jgi:hypothetical protein
VIFPLLFNKCSVSRTPLFLIHVFFFFFPFLVFFLS